MTGPRSTRAGDGLGLVEGFGAVVGDPSRLGGLLGGLQGAADLGPLLLAGHGFNLRQAGSEFGHGRLLGAHIGAGLVIVKLDQDLSRPDPVAWGDHHFDDRMQDRRGDLADPAGGGLRPSRHLKHSGIRCTLGWAAGSRPVPGCGRETPRNSTKQAGEDWPRRESHLLSNLD